MYKLVAIDLDGTMLNQYGIITEKTKKAIKKVQDFSADKIAQKWIDLFNELINSD